MKEVKIVRFNINPDADGKRRGDGSLFGKVLYSGVPHAEQELTQLINGGWEITTAGGGGADTAYFVGFVVLVREQ
jgi:hypothetical protein